MNTQHPSEPAGPFFLTLMPDVAKSFALSGSIRELHSGRFDRSLTAAVSRVGDGEIIVKVMIEIETVERREIVAAARFDDAAQSHRHLSVVESS